MTSSTNFSHYQPGYHKGLNYKHVEVSASRLDEDEQCCCGHVVVYLSGMLSAQTVLLVSGNQLQPKRLFNQLRELGKTWISEEMGEGSQNLAASVYGSSSEGKSSG